MKYFVVFMATGDYHTDLAWVTGFAEENADALPFGSFPATMEFGPDHQVACLPFDDPVAAQDVADDWKRFLHGGGLSEVVCNQAVVVLQVEGLTPLAAPSPTIN